MAVALAALADPTYARVRLTVTGAVSTEVTISRITTGNVLIPVRNGNPAVPVSGTTELYDYEAPLNTPVTWQVSDGGTIATATTTLTVTQAWLKNPNFPSINQVIKLGSMPSLKRSRPQGIHQVLGRRAPIVTYGTLSSKSGSMVLLTGNEDATDSMAAFLDLSGVAYLQIPNSRFSELYLALGDVDEGPLTKLQSEDSVWWTIDIVEVESPAGDLEGSPTSTYTSLKDGTIPNYTNLKTVKTSYLDVMRGSGVPVTPPNPGSF